MGKLKNILFVMIISFLLVVSACGKGADKTDNDQMIKENDTEEVLEENDEDDLEVSIDDDEIESKVEEKVTGEDKPKQKDTKSELTSKETKKEITSSKKQSNNNQSSKIITKKSKNASTPSKQAKSKPKKSPNNSTTTKQPPQQKEPKKEKVEQSVTVAVSIPSGVQGNGLSATKVTISDGDTVLDASLKSGAQFDYSGSGATVYIKGINGLKEFDEGPMSGWQVKVDGALINRSAGNYEVKSNQKIVWEYTTDYSN